MFEDPYSSMQLDALRTHDASKTRYNLLNVLSQLSNVSYSPQRNPISLVPIRHTESLIGENGEHLSQLDDRHPSEVDGPGLLFYYLFDDWWNSYALLTSHDHHYGAELNRLRDEMVSSPRVEHVYSLQHIGRQLACLKRLYESYETVIMRVLEKQRMPFPLSLPSNNPRQPSTFSSPQPASAPQVHTANTPPTIAPQVEASLPEANQTLFSRPICVPLSSHHLAAHAFHYPLAPGSSPAAYDQYGVYLTSGARVRFERLRDRVRLYAIAEIQESIDLKDSLVTMNYNLIAVKEAASMERLTRVTTLLSKATILFLPVSLLSAYFGIEWGDPAGETVTAYWIAFAVIFTITFALLIVFGAVSKTLEGAVLYQSLWGAGVQAARGMQGAGRKLERRFSGFGKDAEDSE
ncbi:MAG: hypothetical protein Q9159_005874 [Coniocarpon cinnabarinum]